MQPAVGTVLARPAPGVLVRKADAATNTVSDAQLLPHTLPPLARESIYAYALRVLEEAKRREGVFADLHASNSSDDDEAARTPQEVGKGEVGVAAPAAQRCYEPATETSDSEDDCAELYARHGLLHS